MAEIDSHSGGGVVTKEIIGKSARGLLNYIGSSKKTGGDRPFYANFSGDSPREIAREFSFLRQLKPNLSRAVAHIIVSVPEIGDDPVLWRRVVEETLKNKGYGDCLFASYIHTDTDHRHVHIFASRIFVNPKTGKTEVVSDSRNFERNVESSRRLEKSLGIAPLVEKAIEERAYASNTKHKAERRESRLQSEKSRSKSIQLERNTVEAKYAEIAEHANKSLERAENPDQWKIEFERRLADAGLHGTVDFHHRGEEVSGWSLLLPGGTSVKGSSISRALGFGQIQKQLLANAEEARARRRRLASAAELADASIALASLARPTAQSALGQLAGPLADAGLPAAGFHIRRQETGEGKEFFEYLDEAGQVAFEDVPDAGILIFARDDAAVLAAVRLAVERHGPQLEVAGTAVQEDPEFRRRLVVATCMAGAVIHPLQAEIAAYRQALAAAADDKRRAEARPPEPALDFLNLPAANDGQEEDDGVDPATGAASGGAGASAGEGEPSTALLAAAHAVLASQRLAGFGLEDAVRRLSIAAKQPLEEGASSEMVAFQADVLTLSQRLFFADGKADDELERGIVFSQLDSAVRALAVAEGKSKAPAAPVIPAVPAADDVPARIARAQQVLKTVLPGSPPRPEQAQKMTVAELTARAEEWASLEPLVQWHDATVARLRAEGPELGGSVSAADRVLMRAENRARRSGGELPTAVARREHREAKEKLQAALDQPLGVLQRFGLGAREREEEVEALRVAEQRARERSVSLRAAFDADEKNQQEAQALQQRLAMHATEHQAVHAVAWAAQAFSSWLKKLWDLVKAAMARDARDASKRREIDALISQARGDGAAADGGAEGQGDEGQRHARQR